MDRDKELYIAELKLHAQIHLDGKILSGPFYSHLGFFWANVMEPGDEVPKVWSLKHVKAFWRKGHVQYMKAGCNGARRLLEERIRKFQAEGKQVELLKGPYFKTHWYRAQVRVDGRRYGWLMGEWNKWWVTGDDLDKQAAASRMWRRKDKLPTVVLEMVGGDKRVYPVDGGRVWVSCYSSIALSDLSFHEFTKVGFGSYRRCYEERHR